MGKYTKKKHCRSAKRVWIAVLATIMALIVSGIAFLYLQNGSLGELFSGIIDDAKTGQQASSCIELSKFVGLPVSDWEEQLDISFSDIGDNRYRADQESLFKDRITLFICTTDADGNVIRVQLSDSGKASYALCGVTTDMETSTAEQILSENGLQFVINNTWKCPNGVDAIVRDEFYWVYEKSYDKLNALILQAATLDAFVYQQEDSAGVYYIGNGQMVEFYHDSFAEFVYYYKELTDYARSAQNKIIEGRYVVVTGSVTSVAEDGTVSVHCQDDEASVAAELLWPMQGTAKLHVVSEQQDILMELHSGSSITALGRIDVESYDNIIGASFDLNDTIIISVNGKEQEIPVLSQDIPGLQSFYLQEGVAVPLEKEAVPTDEDIEYKQCTVDELLRDLNDNALRAEQKYQDQYILLTGKISFFDSDGKYFSLKEIDEDYGLWNDILCNFNSDEQVSMILEYNAGDIVTMKCQVTDIGEIQGYIVDVIEFVDIIRSNNRYETDDNYQDDYGTLDEHMGYLLGTFVIYCDDTEIYITTYQYTEEYGEISYYMDYHANGVEINTIPYSRNECDGYYHSLRFDIGLNDPYHEGIVEILYNPDLGCMISADIENCVDTYGDYYIIY